MLSLPFSTLVKMFHLILALSVPSTKQTELCRQQGRKHEKCMRSLWDRAKTDSEINRIIGGLEISFSSQMKNRMIRKAS